MKKMLCTLALLTAFGASYAQKYAIEGKASSGVKTIYYRNIQDNKIDSLSTDGNGAFKLGGTKDKMPFLLLGEK